MIPTEWDKEHARLTAALQALGERPEGESVEWKLYSVNHRVYYENGGYSVILDTGEMYNGFSSLTTLLRNYHPDTDATLTELLALNPESEVARLRAQVDVLSRNWDATRRELDNFKALLADSNLRVREHSRACLEAEVKVDTLRARVQELEGQVVAEKEDHAFTQSRFEAAHKTFFTVFDALSLVKPTYFDTSEPSGIRRCFDALDSIVTERDRLRTELDAIKAQEARDVEAAAKRIYAVMVAHDTTGMARDWQEGGNSLMQDKARRYARAAVAEARATHCCGACGFDGMKGDVCPACVQKTVEAR